LVTAGGGGSGGAVSLGAFPVRSLRRNNFSKRNLLLWRARNQRREGGARAAWVVEKAHEKPRS
jgi:hypothetical protein